MPLVKPGVFLALEIQDEVCEAKERMVGQQAAEASHGLALTCTRIRYKIVENTSMGREG